MKMALAKNDERLDDFMASAVARELDARGYGPLKLPTDWSDPRLAKYFLEYPPHAGGYQRREISHRMV